MPATVIKSFAQKSGKSEKEVETLWDTAKQATKKQYPDISTDSDRFYQITVGILKKMLKLNEETVTGDMDKYDPPKGLTVRKPDGNTNHGYPYFDLKDGHQVSKLLDGKKKHERWEKYLEDPGIHAWANQNYLKSFFVKTTDGVYIKVR